jgi:hypothetical protein
VKCANCDNEALYVYDVPATDTVYFCSVHLPRFLRKQAESGLLPTTDAYAVKQAQIAEILAPVEEAPVEEPVVEEPAAEEPTVAKPRTSRKKADSEEV